MARNSPAAPQGISSRKRKVSQIGPSVRSRTPQACLSCRRKKQKCDGAQPLCRNCHRLQKQCEWPDRGDIAAVAAATDRMPSQSQTTILSDIFFAAPHLEILRLSIHKPSYDVLDFQHHPEFLRISICALAAIYLEHGTGLEHFDGESAMQISDRLALCARKYSRDTSDEPSVKNIQANLILAFRELVVRAGYNAYIYTGFAIRMAQTLRFGKEYHHRHPHLEREIRRRCMWSCLLMDILVSIDLCRPMAIQTDMISIQLPCPEAAFIFGEDHPSPTLTRLTECQHAVLDLLPYFIKSVVFLKAIDDHVRVWVVRDLCVTIEDEFFDPIETSLTAWIAQLPKRMSWSKHNFRMFCHLGQGSLFVSMHMVLSYSLCLLRQLHLPFVGTGIDNSDGLLSSRQTAAIHHCIHHASQITTIASILYEGDNADREMLRSPFTSLALMCAASIHIWNKHSADHIKATTASASSTHPIEPTPHQQLELLTQVLRSWQCSWPLARGCLDTISLLKQLYDVAYGVAPAPLDEDDAGATASGAEVDLDRTTAIRSGIYDLTGGPSLLSRWTQVLLAVQSESQPVKKEQAQAQLRTLCRHMLLKPQIASIGSEGSDVEGEFDGLTYLNSLEYGNWSGIQGDFDETAVTWEGLGHSFV